MNIKKIIKHNMKNCRQKLYDLVDLGQVEKIEVQRSIGIDDYERKYKYVLKKTHLFLVKKIIKTS